MKNFYPREATSAFSPKNLTGVNSHQHIMYFVKRRLKLLFLCLFLFSKNIRAQSNHTVSFSGNASDFNATEKISAAANNTDYYVTFDQNNLYIGAFATAGTFAATDNLAIYFDTDPNATPTSGTGTTTGYLYEGVTGTLPFSANYNVHAQQGVQEARSFIGGWAATIAGLTYFTGTTSREVTIPFSSIGNPFALNIALWMGNTGGIYSNAPGANLASSANPTIVNYFGTFGVTNGVQGNVNPINVVTSPATGYLSITTGNITAGTYANIALGGNVGLGGNITLAPGGVININSGTFTVAAADNISNTAIINNLKSTQLNVTGTFTLQGRAYCSTFNVNNGGTYNHSSLGSTANGVATDWPGINTRTYGNTSNVIINDWAQNGGTPVNIPAPTSGSWGNVTINITTETYVGDWFQYGAFNNVAGNLILENTGTRASSPVSIFVFDPQGDSTINIGGNFQLATSSGNNNATYISYTPNFGITGADIATMNVKGNFTVNGGNLFFGERYATTVINSWGNYSQTAGNVHPNTNAGIKTTINSYGVNKTISATGGSFSTTDLNWYIQSGAVITLASNMPFLGSSTNATNFTLTVNGTLNCNNFNLEATGTPQFTLSPGGTLGIGSANGISGTGSPGNVEMTSSAHFDPLANYVYNGTANQITGTGLPSSVYSLTIANTGSSTTNIVSLTNPVTITNQMEISTGTFSLKNNNTTFYSNASGTASFNAMGAAGVISYSGTGRFIVERYIPGHSKAWQLLAVPTTGQTVNASWQEGNVPMGNTNPGYGTQITSNLYNPVSHGFDLYTVGPSMKTYDPVSNSWVGITATTNLLANPNGYFLFVRGDRSVSFGQPAVATTLRTTGELYASSPAGQAPPAISVSAGSFATIGNPYASSINFSNVTTTGIDNFYTIWDPQLTTTGISLYGLGAYRTISAGVVVPSSGNYQDGSIPPIQSGQAFFVHGTTGGGGGNVSFSESAKVTGSASIFRTSTFIQPTAQLRGNLFVIYGGSPILVDGVLTQFNDSYSDSLDAWDALKITNSGENMGILSNGKILAIERRQIVTANDTLFYDLAQMQQQQYQFQFIASRLDQTGMNAFLVDNYLKTQTPVGLNDTTSINFTVDTSEASIATNRFFIIFKPAAGPLPGVTFVSVKAYQQNANIVVDWNVENQNNVNYYTIEKSADGITFVPVNQQTVTNTLLSNYIWLDTNPFAAQNYYRIKSTSITGEITYSFMVLVYMGNESPSISVFPDPVEAGIINLQLIKQPAGIYEARLLNTLGQLMVSKEINHSDGTGIESIPFSNYVPHGVYQLEIIKPDGTKNVITIRE